MNSRVPIGLDEYKSDAVLKNVTLFVGCPVAVQHFVSACCVIFIVFGVSGNLITIITFTRFKQIRNATAIFIINLSVADLLYCALILPMVVTTYWSQSWVLGRAVCRLYPLLNHTLVLVSLLTVVAIAINRYVIICHPTHYHRLYTQKNIYIMLLVLWTCAFGIILLPYFEIWGRMSLDHKLNVCSIIPDKNNNSPKKLFTPVLFFITCSVVFVCYFRILLVVRKSSIKSKMQRPGTRLSVTTTNDATNNTLKHNCNDSAEYSSDTCTSEIVEDGNTNDKRKVVQLSIQTIENKNNNLLPTKRDKKLRTMVFAIMISLLICYVPIILAKLFVKDDGPTYSIFIIIGCILIYAAPCINPILYVIMSKEYRQAYKSVIKWNK